ncbi:50S ribosomal protein L3 [bacterium]|nr:50S ribosomal protein L3 [bacterium]MBU1600097.1 50S ribosomal protein L3 [bacterium]
MAIGILGRKLGMSQIFVEGGRVIPVTVVRSEPTVVVNKRTEEKNGYSALQLGYEEKKRANKPSQGYFKKQGIAPKKYLREFRIDDTSSYEVGQKLGIDIFSEQEQVKISGTSKGKGFTGVVKRHNFSGGPASHGSMCGKVVGSIGQSSDPSRVWKNTGMPGRMGGKRVTVKNLKVIKIDKNRGLLFIEGAIPGPEKGLVIIQKKI